MQKATQIILPSYIAQSDQYCIPDSGSLSIIKTDIHFQQKATALTKCVEFNLLPELFSLSNCTHGTHSTLPSSVLLKSNTINARKAVICRRKSINIAIAEIRNNNVLTKKNKTQPER